MRRPRGLLFGIILIAFGVLLLLDNLDIPGFEDVVHTYWPVLIIIVGLSLLVRRSSPHSGAGASSAMPFGASRLSSSTVFGDYSRAVQSEAFTGGTISVTFGDIDLDLLNARLADGEQSLKLDGVFGDTVLRLPEDMPFAVHAGTTFGDVRVNEQLSEGISPSINYESPGFGPATKRLRIIVARVFGDVTVSA